MPSQAHRLSPSLLSLPACAFLALCATASSAANLLPNPHFDTDIAGWSAANPNLSLSFSASRDAGGSSRSGSLQVVNSNPINSLGVPTISFCVPAAPGHHYHAGASFYFPSGQAFGGRESVSLFFQSGNGCTGTQLGDARPDLLPQPGTWQRLDTQPIAAPAGTASVWVAFGFQKGGAGGSLTFFLDDAVFEETSELCENSDEALCLQGARFAVSATFHTATASGQAHAIPLTDDTGYLWFFGPSNVEVVVKVLDGCGSNSRFWAFAGGLTNVAVDLTITDRLTATPKIYHNPLNTPFHPIQDTVAFVTCP